jgi:hypothetical protein
MTRRLATTCLMTMLLLGFSAPPLPAQSDFENVTLKGISSIFVLVEDLPSGARALGLTRDAIQTDVDLKLLLAGMPVVTPEDGTKLPGEPYLWVQVTVTGESQAANIAVAVRQDVRLERNGDHAFGAATWEMNLTIANPTAQDIRDYNKDIVDRFLNAWLSVNPQN